MLGRLGALPGKLDGLDTPTGALWGGRNIPEVVPLIGGDAVNPKPHKDVHCEGGMDRGLACCSNDDDAEHADVTLLRLSRSLATSSDWIIL